MLFAEQTFVVSTHSSILNAWFTDTIVSFFYCVVFYHAPLTA